MKTLLITGANGFIGRHLLALAADKISNEFEIIVLGSAAPAENQFRFVNHQNYSFEAGAFRKAGIQNIDAVVHLGAAVAASAGMADSEERFFANIKSLSHLFNHLPNPPEKFVFASTLDIYGTEIPVGVKEDSPGNPQNLYALSKFTGEKMTEQWARKNKAIIQILRIGHIYGPGEEKYKKLIPETIRKVKQNLEPALYTEGRELRAFLHVRDCCRMILSALALSEFIGPVNLSSARKISVKETVQCIIHASRKELEIRKGNSPQGKDIVPGVDRMIRLLGNEAENFEDGIKEEYDLFDTEIEALS